MYAQYCCATGPSGAGFSVVQNNAVDSLAEHSLVFIVSIQACGLSVQNGYPKSDTARQQNKAYNLDAIIARVELGPLVIIRA